MYQYAPSSLPNTRIDAADILRGFAIGGIVIVHFLEHMNFFRFPKLTDFDQSVWNFVFFWLANKMYAIFSLLFGLSFFVQHDNQAQKGKDFRSRFAWRMLLLFLWGLFDLLFFNGDILTVYAVCGFLVLPFIRCSNKILACIAIFLLLQPVELIYIFLGLLDPELRPLNLGSGRAFMAMMPAQADGSFFDVALANLKYGLPMNFTWAIENGRLTQTIFLFVLGILMGRYRFLYDEGDNRLRWKKCMLYSVIAFAVLYPLQLHVPDMINNVCASRSMGIMLKAWMNLSMMLFYVSAITWLFHCTGFGKKLIVVAPYGKMSLTNYMTQSIFGCLLFYGWGFGLYSSCGHTISLFMGIGFIGIQYMFCRWWLKSHKRGPFEELWRKGTWIGTK